ncbi:transcriptional regulator DeoR family [Clostridium aceticum]|uniref:Transcriptional regulator DeoR family n=1 Tax=Clostridium aceticum TaxID=84022 RepID=A0A0D8IEH9_9CLOT|nr:YafY family protein [Clostridium aceticum]AKL94178.1 transcriptional regulator DeoR family [Clostridium aceticum]KJF28479.1 DeoR faimly transcriptional regulator [Clostridium aceticum]
MKIDRLMAILVTLLRRERVQAKELAEMFEVSVRTILRDIDALNSAGIPIVTYQGANGGIGIVEGYRLDRNLLTGEEMVTILTALKSLTANFSNSKHETLMEKFKNTLSTSQFQFLDYKTNQFFIDISPWREDKHSKKKKQDLYQAIEQCREVTFLYTDSKGIKTNRSIEPYSLVFKGQQWYLYGWCLKREAFRLFKLSRMKNIEISLKVFTPKEVSLEELPWHEKWLQPDQMLELQLLFDTSLENIIHEWFEDAITEYIEDGIIVKTSLPENKWLYGFLLSFGSSVEVISPPHIRNVLAEMAEGIYKKYS